MSGVFDPGKGTQSRHVVLLVIDPGAGAIGITWAIGWFAILFGIVQLWLASVVRRETHGLTRTTRIASQPSGHAVG